MGEGPCHIAKQAAACVLVFLQMLHGCPCSPGGIVVAAGPCAHVHPNPCCLSSLAPPLITTGAGTQGGQPPRLLATVGAHLAQASGTGYRTLVVAAKELGAASFNT
jgi:hypothetical protein